MKFAVEGGRTGGAGSGVQERVISRVGSVCVSHSLSCMFTAPLPSCPNGSNLKPQGAREKKREKTQSSQFACGDKKRRCLLMDGWKNFDFPSLFLLISQYC